MATVRQFLNHLNKPFILVKWKVKVGRQLFFSTTILTYMYKDDNGDSSDQELKLKSTTQGMVQELLVNEGDVVEPGAPLLMLQHCNHDLIIKEICGDCGVDLWRAGMYRNLPETELEATHKQADKIEVAGERELLRERKLALLMSMDEILTDSDTEDILVKIRSGAKHFLNILSQYYDLYLLTSKNYDNASRVIKILDPNCSLTSRLWPYENCAVDAEESAKSIFPHGDSMACIIDRQEQELHSAANIIHVTHFFAESSSSNNIECFQKQRNGTAPKKYVTVIKVTHAKSGLDDPLSPVKHSNSSGSGNNKSNKLVSMESDSEETLCKSGSDKTVYTRQQLDDGLFCLSRILFNVHKAYYKLCDQMVEQRMYVINQKAIPDLKYVIPYVRRNILKGVNIVFSGLAPSGMDIDKIPICILAKSLGASVTNNIILHDEINGTTHIVARKLGTAKTNQAKKFKHLFVVSPEWLLYCEKCWEKVNEKLFLLKKDNSEQKQEGNAFSTSSDSDISIKTAVEKFSSHLPEQTDHLKKEDASSLRTELSKLETDKSCVTAALNISSQDLIEMSNEVEEECTSDSDEEIEELSNKRKSNVKDCELIYDSRSKKKRRNASDCPESNASHSSVWVANGRLRSKYIPVWERAWDADVLDASESGSEYDYIYSEDEDCLL